MMYFVSFLRYFVFEPYDLVTYFVFCSIPLFYGLIVYLKLKFYVPQLLITTKKELRYNQLMFLLFLFLFIFLLGSLEIHHYENILELAFELLILEVYFIPLEFLLCLGLSIFLFLMIVYAYLYAKVKKILLTLFLYYNQYKVFEKGVVQRLNELRVTCVLFLPDKVGDFCDKCNFSKERTQFYFGLAYGIWPMSFRILNKYIYIGIIPYSIWFDIETQNYCLSHVFQVLPWYFLYSLVRGLMKFRDENYNMEGMCFTSFNYEVKGWKLQDD